MSNRQPDTNKSASPAATLREHPGLMVTLTYLALSLIGLLFSYALFSEFGINVFLYAEISDFLLGALREPMTLVMAGAAILTVLLLNWLARLELRWLQRRPRTTRFGKAYLRLAQVLQRSAWTPFVVFVLYSYFFLSLYGEYRSDQIKAGHGKRVTIYVAEESPADKAGNPDGRAGLLLGTTNKFIFVYDPLTKSTDVIPNESILRIAMDTPREGKKAGDR